MVSGIFLSTINIVHVTGIPRSTASMQELYHQKLEIEKNAGAELQFLPHYLLVMFGISSVCTTRFT